VDHGSEARVGLLVARGDAPKFLEPLEAVLDEVPPFIHLGVMGDRRFAIRFGGDYGKRSALMQFGTQGIVVEGLVGDKCGDINACDERLSADAVVPLAGKKNEADEVAQGVDERDDLGRQAATRFADRLILSPPFAPVACRWTLTIVPSMRAYSKSGSFESRLNNRSNTPFSANRRKRWKTEFHFPNISGRSRQGAPTRAIQSTPSKKSRLSAADRPGSPTLPGKSDAMRAHCSSLKTRRSMASSISGSRESELPCPDLTRGANVNRP
jgi:hypothetical protein